MLRPSRALWLFAGLAFTACDPRRPALEHEPAGSASASQGQMHGPCNPAPPDRGGPLIDDFEANKPRAAANRDAFWWSASDDTKGLLEPHPNDTNALGQRSGEGRNRALHVVVQGFAKWGAIVGATVLWSDGQAQCPLNASLYRGVRLRAKGSGSLAVQVPTRDTASPRNGGRCESGCFDHYQKVVQLEPAWKTYTVEWNQFGQQGWGRHVTFDETRIVGVYLWMQREDLPVDGWIDDLEFVPR